MEKKSEDFDFVIEGPEATYREDEEREEREEGEGEGEEEQKEKKTAGENKLNRLGEIRKTIGGVISSITYELFHPVISKKVKEIIDKYRGEIDEKEIKNFAEENGVTYQKAECILSVARHLVTENKGEKSKTKSDKTLENIENGFSIISQIGIEVMLRDSERLDEDEIQNLVDKHDLTEDRAIIHFTIENIMKKNEALKTAIIERYKNELDREGEIVANYAKEKNISEIEAKYFLYIEKVAEEYQKLPENVKNLLYKKDGIKMTEEEHILYIATLIKDIVSSKSVNVRHTLGPGSETKVSLHGLCTLIDKSKIMEKTVEEKEKLLEQVRDMAVIPENDTVEDIFSVFESIYWDPNKIAMLKNLKYNTGEKIKDLHKFMSSREFNWNNGETAQIIGINGETGNYNSRHTHKLLEEYTSVESTLKFWRKPINILGKIKFVRKVIGLSLMGLGLSSVFGYITTPKSQPEVTPAHIEADDEKIIDGKVSLKDGGIFVPSTEIPVDDSEVYIVDGKYATIVYGVDGCIHTKLENLEAAGLQVVPDYFEGSVYTDGENYDTSMLNVRDEEGNIIDEVPVSTKVKIDTRKTSGSISKNHMYYYVEGESSESNGNPREAEGYVVDFAVQFGDSICLKGDNYALKLVEGAQHRSSPDSRSDENILDLDEEKRTVIGTPEIALDGNVYWKIVDPYTKGISYVQGKDIESCKTVGRGKKVDSDKIEGRLQKDSKPKGQESKTIETSSSSMQKGADQFKATMQAWKDGEVRINVPTVVDVVSSEVVSTEVPEVKQQ